MGCVNGKSRTIKTNIASEDVGQQNNSSVINGSNNDSNQQQTSTRSPNINSKQTTDSRNKNTKKDPQNKRKRKKKKDSSSNEDSAGANNEGSSLLSPSTSTNVSGVQRRTNQNGSLLYRYSNSANQPEDTFDSINEKSGSSNSFQNYFNVASDRLHKNFQDRLGGTQTSRNGQKLSDSQLEFFKMLDEKIAQGGETDDS